MAELLWRLHSRRAEPRNVEFQRDHRPFEPRSRGTWNRWSSLAESTRDDLAPQSPLEKPRAAPSVVVFCVSHPSSSPPPRILFPMSWRQSSVHVSRRDPMQQRLASLVNALHSCSDRLLSTHLFVFDLVADGARSSGALSQHSSPETNL